MLGTLQANSRKLASSCNLCTTHLHPVDNDTGFPTHHPESEFCPREILRMNWVSKSKSVGFMVWDDRSDKSMRAMGRRQDSHSSTHSKLKLKQLKLAVKEPLEPVSQTSTTPSATNSSSADSKFLMRALVGSGTEAKTSLHLVL